MKNIEMNVKFFKKSLENKDKKALQSIVKLMNRASKEEWQSFMTLLGEEGTNTPLTSQIRLKRLIKKELGEDITDA